MNSLKSGREAPHMLWRLLHIGGDKLWHAGLNLLNHLLLDSLVIKLFNSACPLVLATLALPGQQRIFAKSIEPGPHQRIADFDLVVKKREWQVTIHRLDPQADARQFNRQWREVYSIDAPFHNMTAQLRLGQRLKPLVIGAHRNKLFLDMAL